MVSRVRELEIRYRPIRMALPVSTGRVASPRDAATLSSALLSDSPVERVISLHFNTKHELIGVHRVSVGCLESSIVHPRDVFQAAILSNASGIVLVHNHPSGDATPSADDVALVRRLTMAAGLMGIDLLDALIIGDTGRYYSFKEAGLL